MNYSKKSQYGWKKETKTPISFVATFVEVENENVRKNDFLRNMSGSVVLECSSLSAREREKINKENQNVPVQCKTGRRNNNSSNTSANTNDGGNDNNKNNHGNCDKSDVLLGTVRIQLRNLVPHKYYEVQSTENTWHKMLKDVPRTRVVDAMILSDSSGTAQRTVTETKMNKDSIVRFPGTPIEVRLVRGAQLLGGYEGGAENVRRAFVGFRNTQ